jgi:hypothetical protein
MAVGFSIQDARRIRDVVKRVEREPLRGSPRSPTNARGSGVNNGPVLIQIVSGTSDTYIVDIYGDGYTEPATKTGETAYAIQISSSETIPVGARFMAFKTRLKGSIAWTFDVPRDI